MAPPSPAAPPRRILLAGVGYVGEALARCLLGARNTVFGLQRSACIGPAGLVALRGDVTNPQSLASLPQQVDTIVYAISPDARSRPAYEDCYERGLTHLLERYPDSHVFLLSSTTVYGRPPETVDDTTPISPATETAKVVARGEQLVLSRKAPSLVIRPSGIYGPGRTRFLTRLRESEPNLCRSSHLTNRVHRDDLVAIISRAINESWTGTLIASDLVPATETTIHTWLKERELLATPAPAARRRGQEAQHPAERYANMSPHGGAPAHSAAPARSAAANRRNVPSRHIVPSRLLANAYEFIYPSFREGYAELTAPRKG